jgi:NitT/TauT family transport system substrate-binding protein
MIRRRLPILFAALLAWSTAASASEPIELALDWIPGGNHAPIYYALAQGWYEAAGLAVTIETGKGSAASSQAVGFGKNPAGIADFGTSLVAIGKGAKLVAVMAIYENAPFTIYWLNSSGIRSVKDLAGRSIGNPPGDAARVMWPALAKASGLAPDAVRWVNIAPQAKLSALKSRAVDAMTDNYNGHDLKVHELGDDMGYQLFRDVGLNPHGHTVIVNADYLAAHRDAVARFVRVTQKAYAACLPDGRPCVEALLSANSGLQLQEHLDQWQRTKELMRDDYAHDVALGGFDPQRMAADYTLIETYFKLETPFEIDHAYTNAFLDRTVKMP